MTTEAQNSLRRRPQAFRMEPKPEPGTGPGPLAAPAAGIGPAAPGPAAPAPAAAAVTIEEQPDAYAREAEAAALAAGLPRGEAAVEAAQAEGMARRRRLGWSGLFWGALGGLVSLSVGLWLSELVEALFARAVALGWIGIVLTGLLVLALLALALRELFGVLRQNRVAKLHRALAQARLADHRDAARQHVAALAALYAARPETARGREAVRQAAAEIIDGADLVDIAERSLVLPLDGEVRRQIAAAAKRVSLVTAISPRAILDLLFVLGQIIVLIRRIAEIYSGRPGLLGFLKLARSVGAHLAVTGGMAVGDSILQQLVGHGIAAKLSARLGEGVLNGLLTTRVGLSAMAVCRPMPFGAARPPGLKEVAPFLFGNAARGSDQPAP